MAIRFNNVVDIVQKLSLDEKEEVKFILEKSIAEQRRDEIYRNYVKSKKEHTNKNLKFSNSIDELKKMVEE